MLPPAVAVICGTLGGLYFGELLAGDFWKPLEPEYFVPGLAAGAGRLPGSSGCFGHSCA